MVNFIILFRDAIAFDERHLKNLQKFNKCNHCIFHRSDFSKTDLRNSQFEISPCLALLVHFLPSLTLQQRIINDMAKS